uniref:Uncharacterized protein AlNc14C739G12472 n=1 Tax=Albugo laibachii Nc14 TaxID=890382 RepID=F0X1Z3_9STRA|nr:conserved hypothetical protein [Albugo laibachii Nc14]|eukprot:CCA27852.1 conserved hypothetical protein [Albugo laibachii Nc14]
MKACGSIPPCDLQALFVAGFQDLQQDKKTILEPHAELMGIASDILKVSQVSLAALEIEGDSISENERIISSNHFHAIKEHGNNFFDSVCQFAANLQERKTYKDAEDEYYLTDECHANFIGARRSQKRNSHPLGKRAKDLHTDGVLVVLFEMPLHVWCTYCDKHIVRGVRYNAK